MRILIDTNILISAALFPKSVPARAFFKAVTPPYHAVVCDYTLDELRRVFNTKFPHKIQDYERFLSIMAVAVEIVSTPPDDASEKIGSQIRDIKDHPILRAAIAAKANALITGDRDFLESGITEPLMITAAVFLDLK